MGILRRILPYEAIRAAAAREDPRGTLHGLQDDRDQTTYRRCIHDGGRAALSLLQGAVCGAGAVALLARAVPGLRGKPAGAAGLAAGVHRRLVQRARLRSGGRQAVDPVGDRLRRGLQQHVHQLAAGQLRRYSGERRLPAVRRYPLSLVPGLPEDGVLRRGRRPQSAQVPCDAAHRRQVSGIAELAAAVPDVRGGAARRDRRVRAVRG